MFLFLQISSASASAGPPLLLRFSYIEVEFAAKVIANTFPAALASEPLSENWRQLFLLRTPPASASASASSSAAGSASVSQVESTAEIIAAIFANSHTGPAS